jgi:phosphatidate cytidylyltransferase
VLIGLVLLLAVLGSPFPQIGMAIVGLICLVEWLLIFVKQAQPGSRISESRLLWGAFGAAYIAAACWGGYLIYAQAGLWVSLWLLVSVWAADSTAFLVGSSVGGPKMAPLISPKKTWSGALGGILAPVFVTLVFQGLDLVPRTGLFLASGLGLALISIAGDLLESVAKRKLGVKDSSGLLPGHGGMLDRVDSLLAVWLAGAAVIWLWV